MPSSATFRDISGHFFPADPQRPRVFPSPPSVSPADHPRSVLVIKWGALGDLVAATTALRALRDAWPATRVTLLANPLMEHICPPGTLVDALIPLAGPAVKGWRAAAAHLALIRRLRRERFDVAINLRWTSERSALIALLSGARWRAGSGPRRLAFLYTHRAALPSGRRHEFERHCDILAPLGIHPERIRPFVFCAPRDLEAAERFCAVHGLRRETTVGIHPGASRPSKAWPADRYASLAQRLAAAPGARVLITWGPGEEAQARAAASGAGERVVVAPPTPRVGGLAALIRKCGVYVCNYSGPMNVAMAVETPLVALGSTSPDDWGPFGAIHRTINKSGADDSYNETEQLAMMERITVDEVAEMVLRRLGDLYGVAR